MAETRSYDKSWSLVEQARQLIPYGTGTNNKAPKLRGVEPAYFERGRGGRIWDVDGNAYLDFRSCLGPITLGYDYPEVRDAIAAQLSDGWLLSGPHPLEVQVAEQLVEMVPGAEMARYLKTGGEAMAAAIKLARAHTGRDVVVATGYHGWLQQMTGKGMPQGAAGNIQRFNYGDLDAARSLLEANQGNVAAVSVAGAYLQMTPDDPFPKRLAELAREHEALVIVDEIVTGFRLAWGGWHEYYGIRPDLAVFGKGMANGMPLSVYLGRAEVMRQAEQGAAISSTFSGEILSLAAAKAVMDVYRREPVIEHLWARGERLRDGLAQLIDRYDLPLSNTGLAPCARLKGVDPQAGRDHFVKFLATAAAHGVLLLNNSYVTYSHSESDIEEALQRLDDACRTFDPDRPLEFVGAADMLAVESASGG